VKKLLLISLIVVFILSDSQFPNFVVAYDSIPNSSGNVCVHLNEALIWEQGETYISLLDRLDKTARIFVNHVEMTRNQFEVNRPLDILFTVHEEDELIGSFGGGISICIFGQSLPKGNHTAKLYFERLSGDVRSFIWVFQI